MNVHYRARLKSLKIVTGWVNVNFEPTNEDELHDALHDIVEERHGAIKWLRVWK